MSGQTYQVSHIFFTELSLASGFTSGQIMVKDLPRFSTLVAGGNNASTARPSKFTSLTLTSVSPATAVIGVISANRDKDGNFIVMPCTIAAGQTANVEGIGIAAVIPATTGGSLPTGVTELAPGNTTTGITLRLACA